MAAKRKLFIAHAGELAHLLVRATGPGELISRFVRSYAERYDRATLRNQPANLREMESTIGREALLVMAAEIRRVAPRAFASGPRGSLSADDAVVAQAFFTEFMASLARAMAGSPQEAAVEAETFQRDLEMYDRWTSRRSWHGPGLGGAPESPFPDRCALLLDPSMMEQARRASADFENELGRAAARIFDHLGRGGLSLSANVSRPRRKATPHLKIKKALPQRVKKALPRPAKKAPIRRAKRAPRKISKAKLRRSGAGAKKNRKPAATRKASGRQPQRGAARRSRKR
jgi:hypothetical protein